FHCTDRRPPTCRWTPASRFSTPPATAATVPAEKASLRQHLDSPPRTLFQTSLTATAARANALPTGALRFMMTGDRPALRKSCSPLRKHSHEIKSVRLPTIFEPSARNLDGLPVN